MQQVSIKDIFPKTITTEVFVNVQCFHRFARSWIYGHDVSHFDLKIDTFLYFILGPTSKKVPAVRSKLTASDPSQSCNVLLTPHVHPRVGLRCIFCLLCLFRMVGGGELDFLRTRWRLQPRLLLLLSGVGLGVQHGVGPRVLLHCVLIKVLDGVDGGVGVRFHHGGWGAASTWPWSRTWRT